MFTCRNQSCRAQWEPSEVMPKDEGQGYFFRCPLCGARNRLVKHAEPGMPERFEQPAR